MTFYDEIHNIVSKGDKLNADIVVDNIFNWIYQGLDYVLRDEFAEWFADVEVEIGNLSKDKKDLVKEKLVEFMGYLWDRADVFIHSAVGAIVNNYRLEEFEVLCEEAIKQNRDVFDLLEDKTKEKIVTKCTELKMTTKEKIMEIAYHYGFDSQLNKTIEECGELIKAISKYKGNSFKSEYLDNLEEEVADVLIMSNQLRVLISKEKIDEIIEYKLDRQLKRMSEGE